MLGMIPPDVCRSERLKDPSDEWISHIPAFHPTSLLRHPSPTHSPVPTEQNTSVTTVENMLYKKYN